jgi:hypothetical protein
MTFLNVTIQDVVRAPPGPHRIDATGTIYTPVLYVGVFSLLDAVIPNGKSIFYHSTLQKDPMILNGYLTDTGVKRTKVIMAHHIPTFLSQILKTSDAIRAFGPEMQLLEFMVNIAHVPEAEVSIQSELDKLQGTTLERQKLQDLAVLFGNDTLTVRYKRVIKGEGSVMVFAAIDLVMLAKSCEYRTAQQTTYRLFKDYFEVDTENIPSTETTCLRGGNIHFVLFNAHGGGSPTTCLEIEAAVEFLMLVPGSELSSQLRKRAAEVLVGVEIGGDTTLIPRILEARKFQEYLAKHDPEHPLRAAGEQAEDRIESLAKRFKSDMEAVCIKQSQTLSSLLVKQNEQLQITLTERDNNLQIMATQLLNQQRSQFMQQLLFSLGQRFKDIHDGIVNTIMNPTGAFIDALRRGVKRPSLKSNPNSTDFPSNQRATAGQLSLSCVGLAQALNELLSMPFATPLGVILPGVTLTYGAWKKCRAQVGRRCKNLRSVDYNAGPNTPHYCSQPLRWAHVGPKGASDAQGGARYVYTKTEAQRYLGLMLREQAPRMQGRARTEDMMSRIRLLITTTVPEDWPLHVSEIEPVWSQ